MRKKTIAWTVTVVGMATSFMIGNALGQMQRQRSSGVTLERITGQPLDSVDPSKRGIDASAGIPAGWSPGLVKVPEYPQPHTVVLRYEFGGLLTDHWDRFIGYRERGQEVEIRGPCYSACTIVMAAVPRERICFDRNGMLLFHLVQYGFGQAQQGMPNMESSRYLYRQYPADIRAWFDGMGGIEQMPHGKTFWKLWAQDLWAMGYKRCAD